jgi:hypothetical protein
LHEVQRPGGGGAFLRFNVHGGCLGQNGNESDAGNPVLARIGFHG